MTIHGVANPNARRNIKFIVVPSMFIGFMFLRHGLLGDASYLNQNLYVDPNSKVVPKPVRFE